MHSCMFSPRSKRQSDSLHLCFPLVSATLLGVSPWGVCSSRLSPDKTGTGGFPPIIIYFYKVYLNNFDVCFLWILSHFWFGNLLEESVIKGPFEAGCLQLCWREFQSFRRIFPVIPTRSGLILFFRLVLWSCQRFPLFTTGLPFTLLFCWKFLVIGGSPKF